MKQIDWESRRRAILNIPQHETRWLAKFSTGFCGVGKMLKRYRFQQHDRCPICNEENETTQHVIQCKDETVQNMLQEEFNNLHKWLTTIQTSSELRECITSCLKQWTQKGTIDYKPTNLILQQAIKEQEDIGWLRFFQGFWTPKWRNCQEQYMNMTNSSKSPILWTSKTQRRIWRIAWSTWRHRNNYLHEDNKSMHTQDTIGLEQEIIKEWNLGTQQLPQQNHYLFSGTMEDLKEKSTKHKLTWIYTVWTAREIINPTYLEEQTNSMNEATIYKYNRWKQRIC